MLLLSWQEKHCGICLVPTEQGSSPAASPRGSISEAQAGPCGAGLLPPYPPPAVPLTGAHSQLEENTAQLRGSIWLVCAPTSHGPAHELVTGRAVCVYIDIIHHLCLQVNARPADAPQVQSLVSQPPGSRTPTPGPVGLETHFSCKRIPLLRRRMCKHTTAMERNAVLLAGLWTPEEHLGDFRWTRLQGATKRNQDATKVSRNSDMTENQFAVAVVCQKLNSAPPGSSRGPCRERTSRFLIGPPFPASPFLLLPRKPLSHGSILDLLPGMSGKCLPVDYALQNE
ncbi:hypothetical protein CB1_001437007 [Camelus ferus]|nr:hypothetical protein CB1_001437007 [Camelus ferus]